MKVISVTDINKHKPLFKGHAELMRKIDTDFYSGKFVDFAQRSTEHIKPKSASGLNYITNYAMVERKLNNSRGNMPLLDWLKLHPDFIDNMARYIDKYWDLKIDNVHYGREIYKTLSKLGVKLW